MVLAFIALLLTIPVVAALSIPALGPPLIAAYCLWALISALRTAAPERVAAVALAALALVCSAFLPLSMISRRRPAARGGATRGLACEARRDARRRAAVALDAVPGERRLSRGAGRARSDVQAAKPSGRRRGDAAARRIPVRRGRLLTAHTLRRHSIGFGIENCRLSIDGSLVGGTYAYIPNGSEDAKARKFPVVHARLLEIKAKLQKQQDEFLSTSNSSIRLVIDTYDSMCKKAGSAYAVPSGISLEGVPASVNIEIQPFRMPGAI